MKSALITGITGQDGSYLSELLLEKGYKVYGMMRRKSVLDYGNVEHLKDKINFIYGDIEDFASIIHTIEISQPDEIYNLASQSYVATSWEQPIITSAINGMGVINLLEAIRVIKPTVRFYQASSSEMFGSSQSAVQNENTPFNPENPYAVSKLYAHQMTKAYRQGYNLHACSGILFNHESERRGKEFVTRKITDAVARIKLGKMQCLELGNLDSKRDWGHAIDYVRAMWLMLQQEKPEDYVIATNETRTVREFVETAFDYVGIKIRWQGTGLNETGIDVDTKKTIIKVNSQFFRPSDKVKYIGDSTKAQVDLNWKHEITFDELVKRMVDQDLKLNQ